MISQKSINPPKIRKPISKKQDLRAIHHHLIPSFYELIKSKEKLTAKGLTSSSSAKGFGS